MKYEKYIGLPYANNGRTEDGIDCWGLVRLFYKNELNIDLPSYIDEYDGPYDRNVAGAINAYKDNWETTTTPDVGALVLFNVYGEPAHVGVYVGNGKFLHSREGKDSVIESLTGSKWSKRFEGYYNYSNHNKLEVVGAPHPLKTNIVKEWTVAGTTVTDFSNFVKNKYKISDRLANKLVVMVDGEVIPRNKWDTTVLQEGQKLAYKSVPEGRDTLRMVLIIVVMIVAQQYGPELGAAMEGGGATAANVSTGYKVAGTVALSMAGMALVNAVLPIRPPTAPDGPGNIVGANLFTGASNQANKFGAIPVVLGKVRMTGTLGAVPYVETLTDTSIMNMLLIWGFGPLEVSDICIGANPIANYYEGVPQDIPVPVTLKGLPQEDVAAFDKLYPQDIEQQFPQVELINTETDGNPYTEVTLANPCSSIDIAFNFPEGMRQIVTKGSNAGNINTTTSSIEIMIRKTGETTWENIVPYSIGNYASSTPNAEAFTSILIPAYYSVLNTDWEGSSYTRADLYRWSTFAIAPGGGIYQFDGAASESQTVDPSGALLAEYKAGNYKSLLGSNSTYSRLPTIPAGYLKIYTICQRAGTVVATENHLNSYSGYQGFALVTSPVIEDIVEDGQWVQGTSGKIKVAISAGKIYEQSASQPLPGAEQTIFTSRQFPSITATSATGLATVIANHGVWNAGMAGESFDKSAQVVFPYTGYYVILASSDDEGAVYIDGRKIIDVPKNGFYSDLKNLYYTEAGTYTVRQTAVNSGGGRKVAGLAISYTANAGLNSPATMNTELVFGDAGFFNKRKDAFNFVYRVRGLERDNYELRVRRTNSSEADPSDEVHNYHKSILYNVTGFDNTKPMKNPPGCYLARTAVRVQSTNKVNGSVDGINAIVQTIALDWDSYSQKWISRPTNNPASLFLYVLMHSANAYRVSFENIASSVDLNALQDWHEFCDSGAGVPLTYNNVYTSTNSVMDVLRDIAAAGKASPAFVDGKWTIVIDRPRTTTVQHFTPHNSWGFESTKSLPKIPDAFRVTIPDETKAYQANEVLVYNYGKNSTNSEFFETLSLPGVTNVAQATHLARWHLAQLKLRPEIYTINVDFEYLVCTRGDVVKVTHDVPMWGAGSGRIKSIDSTQIVLTEEIKLTAGKTYNILVRTNTGSSVTKLLTAITTTGYTDTITLTNGFTVQEGVEVDNLFMLGEVNKESQQLVVLSIEPTSNVSARLTLTDYSPEIYTADLSSMLVYNANINGNGSAVVQNTIPVAPIITNVVSDSALSQQISTGTYQNVLLISFSNPANVSKNAERIQTQVVASDTTFESTTTQNNYYINKDQASLTVTGLETNKVYKIRARYTNATGTIVGPWTTERFVTNNGKNTNTYTAPTISLDLENTYIVASTTTDLNKPADFKTYEYRLYKDAGTEDFWDLDPTTNGILVVQSPEQGRFNLLNVPAPRISATGITYRVACRAVNSTNNYSTESALGTIVVSTIK